MRRFVAAALVLTAVLGLSATTARAGAGGTPTPLSSFFVCQGIAGDVNGSVFDVDIPLLGIRLPNVRIGSATLACTLARLFPPGSTTPIEPLSDTVTGLEGNVKCYAMSARRTPSPGIPPSFDIETVLGPEAGLTLTETRYLCAPGNFTRSPE